jgi:anti-sigma regulatory factor (Ser/Thr protein kinase)
VELRIDDHTGGFELPRRAALPQDDQESGRGLYLIMSLMDHVGYVRSSDSANCLVLQKKLTGI